MTKLPTVKPKELAKALAKLGFKSRHGKGSHVIFYNGDGRYSSVPMHTKPLGKGLLNKIPKQLNVTREQLKSVLWISKGLRPFLTIYSTWGELSKKI